MTQYENTDPFTGENVWWSAYPENSLYVVQNPPAKPLDDAGNG